MIKNLPYEQRDLEIILQKLLVRVKDLEAKVANGVVSPNDLEPIKAEIAALQVQVTTITQQIAVLQTKTRVSCIATQRTVNSAASGTVTASDESTAVAATNNVRRLNNFITNSAEYFEFENSGLVNARIKINKPGRYRVTANATFGRSGNSYLYVQADVSGAGTAIRRLDGGQFNVNVTSGAAGSTLKWTVIADLSVTVPTVLRLFQFVTVRNAGFTYGQFYIDNGQFNDTCSLSVELISE